MEGRNNIATPENNVINLWRFLVLELESLKECTQETELTIVSYLLIPERRRRLEAFLVYIALHFDPSIIPCPIY